MNEKMTTEQFLQNYADNLLKALIDEKISFSYLTIECEFCPLRAERVITEVVTLFGSEGTLVAAETGECVDLSELNRVRAILDFFHDHRIFERM